MNLERALEAAEEFFHATVDAIPTGAEDHAGSLPIAEMWVAAFASLVLAVEVRRLEAENGQLMGCIAVYKAILEKYQITIKEGDMYEILHKVGK